MAYVPDTFYLTGFQDIRAMRGMVIHWGRAGILDRASQLKNVAFGGAWSQGIPRRERYAAAVRLLKGCPERTRAEDLRKDRLLGEAIDMLCDANPKGAIIRGSWERAMTIADPALRSAEILRLVRAIEVWVSAD